MPAVSGRTRKRVQRGDQQMPYPLITLRAHDELNDNVEDRKTNEENDRSQEDEEKHKKQNKKDVETLWMREAS